MVKRRNYVYFALALRIVNSFDEELIGIGAAAGI